MAINLPQGLYTAGAVPFDTSGYSDFLSQLAFKQQARQDALNEYYQNTNKDINPNGLRSQDTQGFLDKYSDFTNYYNQNRAAIQNPRLDGGQAQAEYNSRHQDMLAYANMSKNSQTKHEQVAKLKENPNTAYMVNTPDMIPAIQAMEYPIGDPRHKDIDIDQMQMNSQPMSIDELNKMRAGFRAGMVRKYNVGDAVPNGKGYLVQNKGYDPKEQQGYLLRAQDAYNTNPKVRYMAQQMINDPTRSASAYTEFARITGREPVTEAEIFSGEQALRDALGQVEQDPSPDPTYRSRLTEGRQSRGRAEKFAYDKAYRDYSEGLTRGRTAAQQQQDFESTSKFADDITDPAFTAKGIPAQDDQGKPTTEYSFDVPQGLIKHYHVGAVVNGEDPSGFRVDRNKSYVRIQYPSAPEKIVPWKGFLTDVAAGAPVKKGGIQPATPPAPVPGTTSPTTKKLAPGALD